MSSVGTDILDLDNREFLGNHSNLDTLIHEVHKLLESDSQSLPDNRLLFLIGEGGAGKSRLLAELRKELDPAGGKDGKRRITLEKTTRLFRLSYDMADDADPVDVIASLMQASNMPIGERFPMTLTLLRCYWEGDAGTAQKWENMQKNHQVYTTALEGALDIAGNLASAAALSTGLSFLGTLSQKFVEQAKDLSHKRAVREQRWLLPDDKRAIMDILPRMFAAELTIALGQNDIGDSFGRALVMIDTLEKGVFEETLRQIAMLSRGILFVIGSRELPNWAKAVQSGQRGARDLPVNFSVQSITVQGFGLAEARDYLARRGLPEIFWDCVIGETVTLPLMLRLAVEYYRDAEAMGVRDEARIRDALMMPPDTFIRRLLENKKPPEERLIAALGLFKVFDRDLVIALNEAVNGDTLSVAAKVMASGTIIPRGQDKMAIHDTVRHSMAQYYDGNDLETRIGAGFRFNDLRTQVAFFHLDYLLTPSHRTHLDHPLHDELALRLGHLLALDLTADQKSGLQQLLIGWAHAISDMRRIGQLAIALATSEGLSHLLLGAVSGLLSGAGGNSRLWLLKATILMVEQWVRLAMTSGRVGQTREAASTLFDLIDNLSATRPSGGSILFGDRGPDATFNYLRHRLTCIFIAYVPQARALFRKRMSDRARFGHIAQLLDPELAALERAAAAIPGEDRDEYHHATLAELYKALTEANLNRPHIAANKGTGTESEPDSGDNSGDNSAGDAAMVQTENLGLAEKMTIHARDAWELSGRQRYDRLVYEAALLRLRGLGHSPEGAEVRTGLLHELAAQLGQDMNRLDLLAIYGEALVHVRSLFPEAARDALDQAIPLLTRICDQYDGEEVLPFLLLIRCLADRLKAPVAPGTPDNLDPLPVDDIKPYILAIRARVGVAGDNGVQLAFHELGRIAQVSSELAWQIYLMLLPARNKWQGKSASRQVGFEGTLCRIATRTLSPAPENGSLSARLEAAIAQCDRVFALRDELNTSEYMNSNPDRSFLMRNQLKLRLAMSELEAEPDSAEKQRAVGDAMVVQVNPFDNDIESKNQRNQIILSAVFLLRTKGMLPILKNHVADLSIAVLANAIDDVTHFDHNRHSTENKPAAPFSAPTDNGHNRYWRFLAQFDETPGALSPQASTAFSQDRALYQAHEAENPMLAFRFCAASRLIADDRFDYWALGVRIAAGSLASADILLPENSDLRRAFHKLYATEIWNRLHALRHNNEAEKPYGAPPPTPQALTEFAARASTRVLPRLARFLATQPLLEYIREPYFLSKTRPYFRKTPLVRTHSVFLASSLSLFLPGLMRASHPLHEIVLAGAHQKWSHLYIFADPEEVDRLNFGASRPRNAFITNRLTFLWDLGHLLGPTVDGLEAFRATAISTIDQARTWIRHICGHTKVFRELGLRVEDVTPEKAVISFPDKSFFPESWQFAVLSDLLGYLFPLMDLQIMPASEVENATLDGKGLKDWPALLGIDNTSLDRAATLSEEMDMQVVSSPTMPDQRTWYGHLELKTEAGTILRFDTAQLKKIGRLDKRLSAFRRGTLVHVKLDLGGSIPELVSLELIEMPAQRLYRLTVDYFSFKGAGEAQIISGPDPALVGRFVTLHGDHFEALGLLEPIMGDTLLAEIDRTYASKLSICYMREEQPTEIVDTVVQDFDPEDRSAVLVEPTGGNAPTRRIMAPSALLAANRISVLKGGEKFRCRIGRRNDMWYTQEILEIGDELQHNIQGRIQSYDAKSGVGIVASDNPARHTHFSRETLQDADLSGVLVGTRVTVTAMQSADRWTALSMHFPVSRPRPVQLTSHDHEHRCSTVCFLDDDSTGTYFWPDDSDALVTALQPGLMLLARSIPAGDGAFVVFELIEPSFSRRQTYAGRVCNVDPDMAFAEIASPELPGLCYLSRENAGALPCKLIDGLAIEFTIVNTNRGLCALRIRLDPAKNIINAPATLQQLSPYRDTPQYEATVKCDDQTIITLKPEQVEAFQLRSAPPGLRLFVTATYILGVDRPIVRMVRAAQQEDLDWQYGFLIRQRRKDFSVYAIRPLGAPVDGSGDLLISQIAAATRELHNRRSGELIGYFRNPDDTAIANICLLDAQNTPWFDGIVRVSTRHAKGMFHLITLADAQQDIAVPATAVIETQENLYAGKPVRLQVSLLPLYPHKSGKQPLPQASQIVDMDIQEVWWRPATVDMVGTENGRTYALVSKGIRFEQAYLSLGFYEQSATDPAGKKSPTDSQVPPLQVGDRIMCKMGPGFRGRDNVFSWHKMPPEDSNEKLVAVKFYDPQRGTGSAKDPVTDKSLYFRSRFFGDLDDTEVDNNTLLRVETSTETGRVEIVAIKDIYYS
ncbi:MAG: hypothetical protein EP335_04200 [Alphaproteobacteria bacterium]|nr:MAG: hypothetical protein EP335_04200 [Alphaproteobacteria bacterium]